MWLAFAVAIAEAEIPVHTCSAELVERASRGARGEAPDAGPTVTIVPPAARIAYVTTVRSALTEPWDARLRALPLTALLLKASYTTTLAAVVAKDGALLELCVRHPSNEPALDEAVVAAWHDAAPFAPPPDALLGPDGTAFLPGLAFTVTVGQPRPPSPYTSVILRKPTFPPGP